MEGRSISIVNCQVRTVETRKGVTKSKMAAFVLVVWSVDYVIAHLRGLAFIVILGNVHAIINHNRLRRDNADKIIATIRYKYYVCWCTDSYASNAVQQICHFNGYSF